MAIQKLKSVVIPHRAITRQQKHKTRTLKSHIESSNSGVANPQCTGCKWQRGESKIMDQEGKRKQSEGSGRGRGSVTLEERVEITVWHASQETLATTDPDHPIQVKYLEFILHC